jgi:uncharacterized cupredoxin-like copper-binding protein
LRRLRYTAAAAIALLMTVTAACGGGESGDTSGGERVVEVEMVDNAFNPNALTASVGETVTFKFTNNGSVAHDAFIGDVDDQAEHAKKMKSDSGGHAAHGEEGLTLEPGDSGELSYTFEEPGDILIGCHQPGHYEAGMKATITSPRSSCRYSGLTHIP